MESGSNVQNKMVGGGKPKREPMEQPSADERYLLSKGWKKQPRLDNPVRCWVDPGSLAAPKRVVSAEFTNQHNQVKRLHQTVSPSAPYRYRLEEALQVQRARDAAA